MHTKNPLLPCQAFLFYRARGPWREDFYQCISKEYTRQIEKWQGEAYYWWNASNSFLIPISTDLLGRADP